MTDIETFIAHLLESIGVDQDNISWSTRVTLVAGVLIVSWVFTKLFKIVVIPMVQRFTASTKAKWDDYLFNKEMMRSISRLIPPTLWYVLLSFAFTGMPLALGIMQKVCLIYLTVAMLLLICTFLDSLYRISIENEKLRNRPMKGIYQMIKIIAISVGVIIMISILVDKDASTILAGLGASAAVLMLIFKDSILGLVAGVQLSANDMLRPGDWITMSKYGANGYVIEVSLTTVKVQNFDKTITTVPPYALVSDSYQNWRGMWGSGMRRIMRSLSIDMSSVRFCTEEEKLLFLSRGWISEAQAEKEHELVNLTVFRLQAVEYLKSRGDISDNGAIMVRQLQPTADGIPLEVYCFTATTDWVEYERIQSEVFDYLLAVTPQFGLRVFQHPSGTDIGKAMSDRMLTFN